MRDIYEKLDIDKFDEAEGPMRAILTDRSDHRVSSYKLPKDIARKVADRLKPFIDRYGYREAVEAALAIAPEPAPESKAPVR